MSLRWERLAASGKTLGIAAGNCCRTDRTRRGIWVVAPYVQRKEVENGCCRTMGLDCASCGAESLVFEAASSGAGFVPLRRGPRSRRGCCGRRITALHRSIGIPIRCQKTCCLSWEVASWSRGHVGKRGNVVKSLLFAVFSQSGIKSQLPRGRPPFWGVASLSSLSDIGVSGDSESLSRSEVSVSSIIENGAFHRFHADISTAQTVRDNLSPGCQGLPKAVERSAVTLIAFDIETTGLDRLTDRIIEFACRDLAGGENSTLQTLVNPGKSVGETVKIHCISDEMVNNPNVPKWQEVAPVIVQFVEERRRGSTHVVLISHNGRNFDVPFMINHFNESPVPLPPHWLFLDTVPLAKDALIAKGMSTKKYNLPFLREYYNLSLPQRTHRAMDDVHVLVAVFQNILNDLRLTPTDLLGRAFFASDCKLPGEKVVRHTDARVLKFPSHLTQISKETADDGMMDSKLTAEVSIQAFSTEIGAECAVDISSDTSLLQTQGFDLGIVVQSPAEYESEVQIARSSTERPIDHVMSAENDGTCSNGQTMSAKYHDQTQTQTNFLLGESMAARTSLASSDPPGLEDFGCTQGAEREIVDRIPCGKSITTTEEPDAKSVKAECSEMQTRTNNSNSVSRNDPLPKEEMTDLHTGAVDTALLTPMLKQYVDIKQQRPRFMLLSRVGDFFEAFFEDANRLSQACHVRLTAVDGGKMLGKKVPMAGVPGHRIEIYLKMLLEKGISVVKLDQVAVVGDDKEGSLMRQEVTGVLTPGTILDNSMLEERKNNYLVAILPPSNEAGVWGLAYSDVSTGEFLVTHSHGRRALVQEILRLQPAEIIYPANVLDTPQKPAMCFRPALKVPCMPAEGIGYRYPSGMPTQFCYAERAPSDFFPSLAKKKLLSCFGVHSLEGIGIQDLSYGLRAAGGLLSYLQETQKVSSRSIPLCIPRPYTIGNYMQVDDTVRSHLELMRTSRQGRIEGSLLWAVDHTRTAMGGRLLRQWLSLPLLDYGDICSRHDAVEILANSHDDLRTQLHHKLSMICDLERLAGRVAWKRSDARDLVTLGNSLQVLPSLCSLLRCLPENKYLKSIGNTLPEVASVASRIQAMLLDDPSRSSMGCSLVRTGADRELDRLQKDVENIDLLISSYEKQEQQRTAISSLEVGYARPAGRFISIRKSRVKEEMIPKDYERIQSLKYEERYVTAELLDYDRRRLVAASKVGEREEKLILELREEIGKLLEPLRNISQGIAAVDVLANFADLAVTRNYCRPELLEQGREITIVNGRHPVVETLLPHGLTFVPNSTYLGYISGQDQPENQVHPNVGNRVSSSAREGGLTVGQPRVHTEVDSEGLQVLDAEDLWPRADLMVVTGPNASGKSCYLRQIGLIQLLAQVGSFVPAERSRLLIADGLFTGVGSVDDLAAGEGSFKLEMLETAHILASATSRSLVLLDEVGRGTGAEEGEAMARAIVEYLSQRIRARTVFSTHYHKLHALDSEYPNIANFHFDVAQCETGAVVISHSLKPGYCLHSYGITVGRLSGIPEWVCARAEEHLHAGGFHRTKIAASSGTAGLMDHKVTLEETILSQDDLVTGSLSSFEIRQVDKDNVQSDLSDLVSGSSRNGRALDAGRQAATASEDMEIGVQLSLHEYGSVGDIEVESKDSSVAELSPGEAAKSKHSDDSVENNYAQDTYLECNSVAGGAEMWMQRSPNGTHEVDCLSLSTDEKETAKVTSSSHVDLMGPWRAGRYRSLMPGAKWNVWFGKNNYKERPSSSSAKETIADSSSKDPTCTQDPSANSSRVSPCEDNGRPQEDLDNVWAQVCDVLGTVPATQALAKQKGSLVSISTTSEALVVCIGASALFVRKFERLEHADPLQTAFQTVLRQPVQLKIFLLRGNKKH